MADAFEGVTINDLSKAQSSIGTGGPWRESPQAKSLAGYAIAKAMEELGRRGARTAKAKAKVSALLKTWIKNGMFNVVAGEDAKRMPRKFIQVGEPAND